MEEESKVKRKRRLINNRQELLVLIATAILFYAGTCCFSIIAPFYAPEAKKKGASDLIVGLIFGVCPLVIFLLSPIVGKYIPTVGPKFVLIAGTFMEGGSQIIFGFADQLPEGNVFIGMCFLIRIVSAIGTSCSQTAILAILSVTFKEKLSIVFGILESCSGLGYMSGPALGGFLYKVGGFKLPFFALGGFTLVTLIVIYLVLPKEIEADKEEEQSINNEHSINNGKSDKHTGKITITKLLKIPGIVINGTVTITAGIAFGFLDPTLTNHLEDVTNNTLSFTNVGLSFMLVSVIYSVSAPLVGCLTNGKKLGRYSVIIAHVLLSVSYILNGPSPFVKSFVPGNLAVVLISLAVFGIGAAPFIVPVLGDMQRYGKTSGYPDDLLMNSLVSGIWNSCFSIGNVIGPTMAGALTQWLSYAWATTVLAFFILLEGFIVLIFTIVESIRKRTENLSEENINESSPLLT